VEQEQTNWEGCKKETKVAKEDYKAPGRKLKAVCLKIEKVMVNKWAQTEVRVCEQTLRNQLKKK